MDVFLSVTDVLNLREKQQRIEESKVLRGLWELMVEELNPRKQNPPLSLQLQELVGKFAKLYDIQKRLKPYPWERLGVPAIPYAKKYEFALHLDPHFKFPKAIQDIMALVIPSHVLVLAKELISPKVADDVNAKEILGWSPLHYATVCKNIEHIRELLALGADPLSLDLAGRTPLHYAIENIQGNPSDPAKMEGGESEDSTSDGTFGLHGDAIWALLRLSSGLVIRGRDGLGPLHYAAKTGNILATILLLRAGANIEIEDSTRKTPLHWAAYSGNVEVATELLKRGADIGALDYHGSTALHFAVIGKVSGMVKMFLARAREDMHMLPYQDRDGRVPLHLAVMIRDMEALELLLPGAKLDTKDRHGRTALHYAVLNCHEEMTARLMKAGASINVMDDKGERPLHIAANSQSISMMRLLLENDASTDFLSYTGMTALGIASFQGHEEMVQLLLHHKAKIDPPSRLIIQTDISAQENEFTDIYFSALAAAAGRGHKSIVELLLEKEAEPNFPVQASIQSVSIGALKNSGINIYPDALSAAAGNKHTDILDLLRLKKGANTGLLGTGNSASDLKISGSRINIAESAKINIYSSDIELSSCSIRLEKSARINFYSSVLWEASAKIGDHKTLKMLLDARSSAEVDPSSNFILNSCAINLEKEARASIYSSDIRVNSTTIRLEKGARLDVYSSMLWEIAEIRDRKTLKMLLDAGVSAEVDPSSNLILNSSSINLEKEARASIYSSDIRMNSTSIRLEKDARLDVYSSGICAIAETGDHETIKLLLDARSSTEVGPSSKICLNSSKLLGEARVNIYNANLEVYWSNISLEGSARLDIYARGLRAAVENGYHKTLKLLLDAMAANHNQPIAIKILVEGREAELVLPKSAEVNIGGPSNCSCPGSSIQGQFSGKRIPLVALASAKGHMEVVRLLLTNPHTRNYDGAVKAADSEGYYQIAAFIRSSERQQRNAATISGDSDDLQYEA